MTSKVFNYFKQQSVLAYLDTDDDIYVALCSTNSDVPESNDGIQDLADLTLDEFDGANYVRKKLANTEVNLDDANDRAEFDADDVTWTSLGAGTRAVEAILIYKDADDDGDSADDASNPVIANIDKSITPDGNDLTISWNAEGIIQLA